MECKFHEFNIKNDNQWKPPLVAMPINPEAPQEFASLLFRLLRYFDRMYIAVMAQKILFG